jgi:phosphopantetheinyl transferase (holo-ACP synthase)
VWSEPIRRDWLASRLAATRATTALLARSAARTCATSAMTLSISLSHSDGHAIAAATQHPARVGVDLERDGAVAPAEARYFLSAREQRQRGHRSLTEMWALKESAWKALGCDDETAFSSLELILNNDGALYAVRLRSAVLAAVAELRRPWIGWTGTIVVLTGFGI